MFSLDTLRPILNPFLKMKERTFLCIYLGVIFLYCVLIGLQGFDMCDEGFCLTAYQQLFEHPSSAEYQFLYYNGVLVGAIWNSLFAECGIYGFRILTALCCTAISLVVYFTLRDVANRWFIFLGQIFVLLNQGFVMVFHHNSLTALFVCCSALLIYKAMLNDRYMWILLAGMVVGLNIFTRIPNISMFALILVMIPYGIYVKEKLNIFRMLLCALVGVLLGFILQFGIMSLLGHWELFVNNLSSGFSAASANDSSHNMLNIWHVYIENYRIVLIQMVTLSSYPILIYLMTHLNSSKWLYYLSLFIGGAIYAILIWRIEKNAYALYAFCYLVFLIYLLRHPLNRKEVYLLSLATLILFFLPFGSDHGIGNMGPNSLWMPLSLAFGLFHVLYKETNSQISQILSCAFIIFVVVFISHKILLLNKGAYFDYCSRLEMKYKINHPLANTYTSKTNVVAANELLVNLNKYVREGSYMLTYQSCPMMHYLTHTYPYLNNSWPISYTEEKLEEHFRWAEANVNVLPVILRNKSVIAGWTEYAPEWDDLEALDQGNFATRKVKLIQDFITKYDYQVVWENDLFQILETNKKIKVN